MKQLIVISTAILFLSGCVSKEALQKSGAAIDDEPVMVTSSVSIEITQEMIDRFKAREVKKKREEGL